MLIIFQERREGSGIYFERSMLSPGERVGKIKVGWYDGPWVKAVKSAAESMVFHVKLWRMQAVTRNAVVKMRGGGR